MDSIFLKSVQGLFLKKMTRTVNERGLTSINYTLYTAPTVRTTYSSIPTSTITACAVVADGFTLSQTDYAGIASTAARNYTASGMVLVNTDGRNNATTAITDLAGRTVSVTGRQFRCFAPKEETVAISQGYPKYEYLRGGGIIFV